MEIILDYRLVDSYNNGSVETNFSSFFLFLYILYQIYICRFIYPVFLLFFSFILQMSPS